MAILALCILTFKHIVSTHIRYLKAYDLTFIHTVCTTHGGEWECFLLALNAKKVTQLLGAKRTIRPTVEQCTYGQLTWQLLPVAPTLTGNTGNTSRTAPAPVNPHRTLLRRHGVPALLNRLPVYSGWGLLTWHVFSMTAIVPVNWKMKNLVWFFPHSGTVHPVIFSDLQ